MSVCFRTFDRHDLAVRKYGSARTYLRSSPTNKNYCGWQLKIIRYISTLVNAEFGVRKYALARRNLPSSSTNKNYCG